MTETTASTPEAATNRAYPSQLSVRTAHTSAKWDALELLLVPHTRKICLISARYHARTGLDGRDVHRILLGGHGRWWLYSRD